MMFSLILIAILLSNPFTNASSIKDATSTREIVNFDFGWKFILKPEIQCPDSYFPISENGFQCTGLKHRHPTSLDDCRTYCCADVMCAVWQFSSKKGCWTGDTTSDVTCRERNSLWKGGRREVPGEVFPPHVHGGATARDFNDDHWELIDLPHDGLIGGTYSQDGPSKQAYLPKNTTWYRKHFNLPADWKRKSNWVYFEGIFRASLVYLNGELLTYHDSGYTSFAVRLDNATSVYYGDGKTYENVITVRATSDGGSGWWYEGGGIYRHAYLISTSTSHFVFDGVYASSMITGDIHYNNPDEISKGMFTDSAIFIISAEFVNELNLEDKEYVYATLYDEEGNEIGSGDTPPNTMGGLGTLRIITSFNVTHVSLWTPARPYMYTMHLELFPIGDSINISIGVRNPHWDPNVGFSLNGVHFTWRGFNNHNDFAGVGMAVPDRINLFRGQSMRAVGANSWRMSHNPPAPIMLDIVDNLGILVWNENREFGNRSIWVQNQRNMVRRDRNHPSVVIWSFCNEKGCYMYNGVKEVGRQFRNVSYEEDPYRHVTANMNYDIGGDLTPVLDVQGFSHRQGEEFDAFHKSFPYKPLIGSECCSCITQRGEDSPNPSKFILSNFNAPCLSEQTERQLNRKYVSGCMVWTLFDYYGEPSFGGWPHVSSSFGAIDLAGFAKEGAYWFRSWWLYNAMMNHSTGGIDVPINPPKLVNPDASPSQESTNYIIHIVQHWEPNKTNGTASNPLTINVYTNAPIVELFVNGESQGAKDVVWQGWAEWTNVRYRKGNLTAVAIDYHEIVAVHTILSNEEATKVKAYVDVPSMDTGTGTALVLDGQDTGMVSAAILDSNDRVVHRSERKVTFSIVSGPGRIIGVGNGDPQCHEPNKASWRSAYHGLARAIVQVTEDHSTSPSHRRRLIQIDRDGSKRTRIQDPSQPVEAPDAIVVQASVEGIGSSTVTIPVTTDVLSHGVLNVAKASLIKD